MNISLDAGISSTITAFIVGVISVASTIIANKNSFRQQQAQWVREEKKAERDERQTEYNREIKYKKAKNKKLQDIYGNSIASLTTLLIYDNGSMRLRPDYSTNLADMQKWLSQVIAYHYDKTSEEYATFLRLYRETRNNYKGYENIIEL